MRDYEAKMTAEDFRKSAADSKRRSYESFERSDTDGFLSQWANDIGANLDLRKADILDNEGKAYFAGLYDSQGNRVPAKLHTTTFNYRKVTSWMLRDDAVAKYGRRFIPTGSNSRIQKALGLRECGEMAPAWAAIMGEGTGLSGCANAYTGTYRTGCKWGMDAEKVAES